jgi:hypothetical protein
MTRLSRLGLVIMLLALFMLGIVPPTGQNLSQSVSVFLIIFMVGAMIHMWEDS